MLKIFKNPFHPITKPKVMKTLLASELLLTKSFEKMRMTSQPILSKKINVVGFSNFVQCINMLFESEL